MDITVGAVRWEQLQPYVDPPLARVPGVHQDVGGEESARQGEQDDGHQKGIERGWSEGEHLLCFNTNTYCNPPPTAFQHLLWCQHLL